VALLMTNRQATPDRLGMGIHDEHCWALGRELNGTLQIGLTEISAELHKVNQMAFMRSSGCHLGSASLPDGIITVREGEEPTRPEVVGMGCARGLRVEAARAHAQ